MKKYDFLIVGAGIFGIITTIELIKKKYTVGIINSGQIPHPLAASTDISKMIRMEYGTDIEYMEMVIESMEKWREWNDLFDDILYHEIGYIVASSEPMENERQHYDYSSYQNVLKKGYTPERLDNGKLSQRFPAFKNVYADGFYHAVGGFAESGRSVETLAKYAKQLGVDIFENQTAEKIEISNNIAKAVRTKERTIFHAGHIIICAGNSTPYLIPELKPYIKITGHPVFHLKPSSPELFTPPNFAPFLADVSNTGWYGFPLHPTEKIVKVSLHTDGLELHPEEDERVVYKEDELALRKFLKKSLPALANDPIVYTRRCCYTDTLDGHFLIDRHPEIKGLTIGSGGSGHGFKMGPVVGDMIAKKAEGGNHKWSDRYCWRELSIDTLQEEEARFMKKH